MQIFRSSMQLYICKCILKNDFIIILVFVCFYLLEHLFPHISLDNQCSTVIVYQSVQGLKHVLKEPSNNKVYTWLTQRHVLFLCLQTLANCTIR